ncbi:trigger factor [Candidatus Gracilibacteria bacterium]|nr:trigger factor [Candidatus Gracilibacteria bacterium]
MKIEKKSLEKSIVELIVEESVENVAKHRKKALAYMQENADIQGFRKGTKIPENVIIRKYGEEHIARMTIEFAIEDVYRKALSTEKILPVAQGEIKEVISESPLKIKIHIEVFPQVEIDAKYKKIALTKKKVSVTAAEVKAALEEIEKKFTKFEEETSKTAKAKMGDQVTIDTDGFEKGKALEATSMRDYPIVLGSNMLVPGFEESIEGMKTGEEKEFPVEFPKDYHNPDFAGKKTTFKVTVKKLEKAVKPEFTPEFIEQLRGKKLDLDGFKALIKSEIADTKESNARMDEENELIDALLKVSTLDIGDKLLAKKIDQVFGEIKENISQDGVKMGDYLESLKLTEDDYKAQHVAPVALKRLQGELILHKLSELEKIEVTDKELEKEIEQILSRFESEDVLKRLKELYIPGTKYYEELKQKASYRKLIDSFFKASTAKKAPAKKK